MQFPWKCNLSFPHHLTKDWKIRFNTSVISFLELQELIKIYLVLIKINNSRTYPIMVVNPNPKPSGGRTLLSDRICVENHGQSALYVIT